MRLILVRTAWKVYRGHVPPYLFCSHVIAALPHPVTVDSAVIAARCRTFSRCIGLNIRIS